MTKILTTKPVVDPNEMLPEVEKMLYKQAWKLSENYGIPFEEARSEAQLAFMRACYDFKPERGAKFSTWCYYWVWCQLKDFITRRTNDPLIPTEINEEMLGEAPPEHSPSLELVAELSSDAQEVVSLLLETRQEAEAIAVTAKQLLRKIRVQLVEEVGWERTRFDKAHEELHTTLNHAWRGGGHATEEYNVS